MEQGTVLRIEKISPNDGMGLRTVVFLKGCPLRCAWCSTPEGQSTKPEWYYKQAKCLHCGRCIRACPEKALSVSEDRTALIHDRAKCVECFRCADVCPTHAVGVYGKLMTVEEVMREIRKESLFYFHSGGGVTLSGGDILLQADFAAALLKECKQDCIHTMAELDLFGAYDRVAKLAPLLDACFVDVKHMDSAQHKRWTGVDNETILQNLLRLSSEFPQLPLHIRVPLIPGVNDSEENILATAEFCRRLTSCQTLEFLPYHRLGIATYQYTQRDYPMGELEALPVTDACSRVEFLCKQSWPFSIQVSGKTLS